MNQLLDLLPVAIFVAAYFLFDIYVATAALMVAVSIQVAVLALLKKPVSRELKFTLVASLVFGALTLFFRNELFIQWKPTIVNWLLAATLVGSHLLGRRNLLKQLLGKQLTLVDDVWTRLNFGWACGFFFAGALNLVVAYGFSMEVWVSYKLIGGFALTFLYVMLTMVYLSRKGLLNPSGAAAAGADGGRPATVPDHDAGLNQGIEVEKKL